MSTFEFWLELAWLGGKGKTLLVIEIFFTLHRYCTVTLSVLVLSIQSKTWSSFLSALLNWCKNLNVFKLAVLQSDSMKRNYEGLIFNNKSIWWWLQVLNSNYCIRENCSQYAEFSFDLLFEGVEVNKNQYKIRRHNGDLFFVIQKIHLEKKYSPSGWLSYPFIELICV